MASIVEKWVGTTRIVGEQERFNQSRVVYTRAALGEMGQYIMDRRRGLGEDRLRRIFYSFTDNNLRFQFSRAPEGRVYSEKIDVSDPEHITQIIKGVARYLGADLVGVTALEDPYIYSHRGQPFMIDTPEFGTKVDLTHRYAICVAVEQDLEKTKASPSYITDIEVGFRYLEVSKVASCLASYIRELGYPARAHHFGHEEVLQVPLAVKAGLGDLGRSGHLITREYGPRVRLGTVTTDIPLIIDKPVNLGLQEFCKTCKKCAINCPSRSLPMGEKTVTRGVEKWQMNPDSCLRYWLSKPGKWESCSTCVTVCPWNKPNSWYHRVATLTAARSSLARNFLLWLDDRICGKRPRYKIRWLDYGIQ